MTVRSGNSSPLAGEEGARRAAVGRRGGRRNLLRLAKKMRSGPTEAEQMMWSLVRGKRLDGLKFKRQEQIGDYIVDFVCFEKRLIVEIDGGQHSNNEADQKRDAWLREQAFEVHRFWNNDVLANPEGVARVIMDTAAASPTSTSEQARKSSYPLRQAERSDVAPNSSPLAGEEGARREAVGRRGGE